MSLSSRVLGVIAGVVVAAGLASVAHATIIADWTFDGVDTAWLNDSSGNGHTLQANGVVSQGAGGTASFSGAGWLTTIANLDLSGYRQIKISWSQNGPAITEPTHITFNMTDSAVGGFSAAGTLGNNWPSEGGRWDSLTGPEGALNVTTCPAGTMLPNVWEQYSVVFDLDATDLTKVVRVYKGTAEVGVNNASAAAPASFLSNSVFAIGAGVAGGYPYTGLIDNFKIEGTAPEPGTLILVATGLLGLLSYAWRRRKN